LLNQNSKIINLSLHRSGTQSANHFFSFYGLKCANWVNFLDLHDDIESLSLDEIIKLFEKIILEYKYFSNPPFNLMHTYFEKNFTGSKFIYIKRNPKDWIESVKTLTSHRKNGHFYFYETLQYEKYLNFKPNNINSLSDDQMLHVYNEHEKTIFNYFKNKNNLLIIDLNSINNRKKAEELINFLSLNEIIPDEDNSFHFPKTDMYKKRI